MSTGPKVLLFDLETAPIIAHVWGLWDQNVGLNQIIKDWHILAWAAKWLGKKEIIYKDQRYAKSIQDDKALIKPLWSLLDEADIVITQNGKSFDQKRVFGRFIQNGFQKPSSFKHIDIKLVAKKHLFFPSYKLEYMAKALGCKNQKMTKRKFEGFELWSECLKGNPRAWEEMEKYNKLDVLVLEEVYHKLQPWDSSVNFESYSTLEQMLCNCGSMNFKRNGLYYGPTSVYERFKCNLCGAEKRSRKNIQKRALSVGSS